MSREFSVHLPERVWAAIVDFDLHPRGWSLEPLVRQCLLDAGEIRQEQPIPVVLRVVTLSTEQADVLENWLSTMGSRTDAPRDCRTALELIREGRRLNS